MSPQAVRREMRVIAKVTQRSKGRGSEESEDEVDSLDEDEEIRRAENRSIEPDYSGQGNIRNF